MTPSKANTWRIVMDEYDEYFSELIAKRRAEPRDDLASLIANAKIDGRPMEHVRAISILRDSRDRGSRFHRAHERNGNVGVGGKPELAARTAIRTR